MLGEAINRRASAGARFADALGAAAGARSPDKRALGWALVLGAAAEYEWTRHRERAVYCGWSARQKTRRRIEKGTDDGCHVQGAGREV